MIMLGQLPLFVWFIVNINQQSLKKKIGAIFFLVFSIELCVLELFVKAAEW